MKRQIPDKDSCCTLRPLKRVDIPRVYALQHDREAAAMAGVPGRFMTEQEFTASLTAFLGKNHKPTLAYAIMKGDDMAGYIGCFPYGETVHRISFWIERAFWGQGLATSALYQLLQNLPPYLLEKELEAGVIEGNEASAKVLKRCGFEAKSVEKFHSAAHNTEKRQTIFIRPPGTGAA